MRTTIRLDEELLRAAKQHAAACGMTLTAVIEKSLRERLARASSIPPSRSDVKLTTSGSGGLMPGVDLDDSAELLDVMNSET